MLLKITNTIALTLLTYFAIGQIPNDRRENIKLIDSSAYQKYKHSYPITRDTLNQYPDSVTVEGEIVDFTLGISCGTFCGCGTIKIKVTRKSNGYKHPYIYVGIPCFPVMTKELEKTKNWTLYKLPLNDTSCYWTEVPMNKFNTNGLPFYTMRNYYKK